MSCLQCVAADICQALITLHTHTHTTVYFRRISLADLA